MKFQVQGYALPWDRSGFAEFGEETAAPTSVAPPRPEGCNVLLIFGDHETVNRRTYAQTKDRSLTFFADAYGLGFSAWLDDDIAAHAGVRRCLAAGEVTQCSVNLIDHKFIRAEDGRARLIYGRIDHVALVAEGAYPDTGCWLAAQPYRQRHPSLLDMSFIYGKSIVERARAGHPSQSPVASASLHVVENGKHEGRGSRSAPLGSIYAQIRNRLAELHLPIAGTAIGMSPKMLLVKLDQMAEARQ